jgi:hypothetical protein
MARRPKSKAVAGMKEDSWLESQIAEMRAEAANECFRCQGRRFGDCSPDCRFWRLTATDAERFEAAHPTTYRATRKKQEWTGPRTTEEELARLELARLERAG